MSNIVDLIFFPHFLVMVIAVVIISIGLIVVAFHKPEQWFLLHRIFMGLGLFVAIIGFILLIIPSIFILHAIFGLIILIFLTFSVIGGFFATKKKEQNIRNGHIWMGRILYILILVTIILGILTFLGYL